MYLSVQSFIDDTHQTNHKPVDPNDVTVTKDGVHNELLKLEDTLKNHKPTSQPDLFDLEAKYALAKNLYTNFDNITPNGTITKAQIMNINAASAGVLTQSVELPDGSGSTPTGFQLIA